MSELRAGYDVVETLYLEETTFGQTPSGTETWKPIWLTTNFDPRPRITQKEKIGLGRQLPSNFVKVKESGEFTIEHELLAKEVTPAFEWITPFFYIVTDGSQAANPVALTKRLKSLSIGAKLDLATDEFWLLKGCKLTGFEISAAAEEVVTGRISGICQKAIYGTTDYKGTNQTRQANPTTDYIKFGDCDILLNTVSILSRLNSFTLGVTRDIAMRGSDSTTKTLYRTFAERRCELSLRINLDFDSTTELNQFLNQTALSVDVSIPAGTGGRKISLSSGKWREFGAPKREVELIAVDLTANFGDLNVYQL